MALAYIFSHATWNGWFQSMNEFSSTCGEGAVFRIIVFFWGAKQWNRVNVPPAVKPIFHGRNAV